MPKIIHSFGYLYNTATSVKRTLSSVPLVSVLKRFDCMPENMNKVERNTLSLWIICCHFQSSVPGSVSACEEQLHPSRKIAWLSMQSAHQTDANTIYIHFNSSLSRVFRPKIARHDAGPASFFCCKRASGYQFFLFVSGSDFISSFPWVIFPR